VAGLAAALLLSACGGGAPDGQGSGNSSGGPGFNAALTDIVNPSETKGGTLKFANSGDWDTLDPGETYYGYSWNFARLYGRSLLMFKAAPGAASNELVPDLAEDLGQGSKDGKTWTYKLRQGVKFEDGTEVTAKDVKYAVLRSTTCPRATRAPTSRRTPTPTPRSRPRTTTPSSSTPSSRSRASTTSPS
jgi:peptide/nickel transport system substrate-binding protein